MNPKSDRAGKTIPASLIQNHNPNANSQETADGQTLPDGMLPLRLKTIARLIDVSEKTVRRWIQRGLLRSYKLGGSRVVRKCDLITFLDQQFTGTNKEAS